MAKKKSLSTRIDAAIKRTEVRSRTQDKKESARSYKANKRKDAVLKMLSELEERNFMVTNVPGNTINVYMMLPSRWWIMRALKKQRKTQALKVAVQDKTYELHLDFRTAQRLGINWIREYRSIDKLSDGIIDFIEKMLDYSNK